MTLTIQQRIKQMEDQINFDDLLKARDIALELIWTLVSHPRWEAFVTNFTDNGNARQLLRLKLQDDRANDRAIRQTVCYLLANAVCGGGTGKRLHENIDGILDEGLPSTLLPSREEQAVIDAKRIEAEDAAKAAGKAAEGGGGTA
jgi:hypothetical protein